MRGNHLAYAATQGKRGLVFVSYAIAHHSEWLESVSPTDRHGRDALDFCNLSGCEQLVRCPTRLMLTDSI